MCARMRDTWRTISGWQDEIRASKDRFSEYATGEFDAYRRVLGLISQDYPCCPCDGTGVEQPENPQLRTRPVDHKIGRCNSCEGTGVCDA